MKRKIVHVTEAFGGGVLHCVVLLANLQAEAGDKVVILHSIRPDTPSSEKLDALLDPRVTRRELRMTTAIGPKDIVAFFRLLLCLVRERADIVHLHSSKAGALGRIAARILGVANRTIYSPHGFAFLRKDISSGRVRMLIAIERLLHAIGGNLIGCSRSEVRYATMLLSRRRVGLVENAVDLSRFAHGRGTADSTALTVCTSARVTYQKAPWRFSQIASDLAARSRARFVWLGGGEADAVSKWIDQRHVELSGWIEHADLRRQFECCDVFLLPSLWEGMPLALIEAQAAGLPAVASRIVGNRDVIVHGVTGFLANTDEELAAYTLRLLEDEALRRKMGAAAREQAFARFGTARFLRGFDQVYTSLAGRPAFERKGAAANNVSAAR